MPTYSARVLESRPDGSQVISRMAKAESGDITMDFVVGSPKFVVDAHVATLERITERLGRPPYRNLHLTI